MATLKDIYGRILYHYNPKEGEEDTVSIALTVAALRRVTLPLLDLREQALVNLNLSGLIAPYADFSKTTIQRVDLSNSFLEGMILSGASLQDVILRGAIFENESLSVASVKENIITQ